MKIFMGVSESIVEFCECYYCVVGDCEYSNYLKG